MSLNYSSKLTWLDHDQEARDRTLRILSLFQEKESRDELGLGAIRDSFADQLFPGTSTIQTRLRYMFFVPWIYLALENKKVPAGRFAVEADELERRLIPSLLVNDDRVGIFGKTAGKSLKRLPSSVYWSGLGTWGIKLVPYSQEEYHRRIDEVYRSRDREKESQRQKRESGDDLDHSRAFPFYSWHPRLPKPPETFPDQVDIALTKEEAEFILDRLQAEHPDSLLSFLALNCEPVETDFPWQHPDMAKFTDNQKELLSHARLFSETMHGAAILYNYQLAEKAGNYDLIESHSFTFNEWASGLRIRHIKEWQLKRLWEITNNQGYNITYSTQHFVEKWINFTRSSPHSLIDNIEAKELVMNREIRLKGSRSRFKNQRALDQWSGFAGMGRLTYRWPNVKRLLNDLYQGLQGE